MPKFAVIVHGYSESSLSAYARFPDALQEAAPELQRIVLSAFNSLDDGVTIDDLAQGLETRMAALEALKPWDTTDAVFICHSTGALVARRWILNRLDSGKPIPSHLITMAGAWHGSTLAQLGRTPMGYAQKYLLKHSLSVGARVLIDLDYGSDFLLRLNREWLAKRYGNPDGAVAADARLAAMFQFTMGGDSLGTDDAVKTLWQSSESGSDNTVRISGANCNYTYLVADAGAGTMRAVPSKPQPHLIIPGFSHYGPDTGILASNIPTGNPAQPMAPIAAIRQALNVTDVAGYNALIDAWSAKNAQWVTANQDSANATIVFSVHDRGGGPISDCFIGLLDAQQPGLNVAVPTDNQNALVKAMLAVTPSIQDNNTERGSYSFYVNVPKFYDVSLHLVTVQAQNDSTCVTYGPLNFTVDHATVEHLLFANQFTYIDLALPRNADESFALFATQPIDTTAWPPFSKIGRIV
jgi:pimeloyl-ACP methyl ester carboxylesterase